MLVLTGALTLGARRLAGSPRALLLGAAAGICFGLQASLMQRSVRLLHHSGVEALLTTWSGYAVLAVAVLGMLLVQSAFNAAPLAASYPAVVSGQLLCSLAIGVWVLGAVVSTALWSLVAGAVALVAMLVGIWLLTRSHLVAGPGRRSAPGSGRHAGSRGEQRRPGYHPAPSTPRSAADQGK